MTQWQSACQTFIELWASPQMVIFFSQGKIVIAIWPLKTAGVILLILLYFIGVCIHLCTQICLPICVHMEARGLICCSLPYWLTDWLIHWDRISDWIWSSLFEQAPGNCLSVTPWAGIIDVCYCAYVTVIIFYLSSGNMNSGLRACRAATFSTEPPSQTLNYSYLLWFHKGSPIQSQIHNLLLPLKCWHYKHASQCPIKNSLLLLCICASVGMCVLWPICGGQNTTLWSQFSPSTFMCCVIMLVLQALAHQPHTWCNYVLKKFQGVETLLLFTESFILDPSFLCCILNAGTSSLQFLILADCSSAAWSLLPSLVCLDYLRLVSESSLSR